MDLDLAIKACPEDFEELSNILVRAGLKASVAKIASAWSSGSCRIITCRDTRSPHSLDIILSEKPLRRIKGTLLGMRVFYHEPSQLILAKLRMIKSTRDSERQAIDKADIRSIMASRKIPLRALREGAKRDDTIAILQGLLRGRPEVEREEYVDYYLKTFAKKARKQINLKKLIEEEADTRLAMSR